MRPRFRYRVWRPRPEFRKVTPDIERLDLTHTVVEDLDGSPDHPMDADVLSVVLSNHRHVEEVAVGLNLEEDDIIVCNGQAFRVRWPFDVERIGVVDPLGGMGEKPVGETTEQ